VLVVAAASIVFSLVVQGFTLEPLARFAGIGQRGATAIGHENTIGRLRLTEAALARLDELSDDDAVSDVLVERVRASLEARVSGGHDAVGAGSDGGQRKMTERELRRDLIAAEMAELGKLFDDGTISVPVRESMQRGLDLELARLSD
jgi:monovalent cation/hydrogen antiporter